MARRKEKKNNPVKLRVKNGKKASIKATSIATNARNHANAKRLQGSIGRQEDDRADWIDCDETDLELVKKKLGI